VENVGGGLRRSGDGPRVEDVRSGNEGGQRHRVSDDRLLRMDATHAERASRRAGSSRSVIGARFDANRREEDAAHELHRDDHEQCRDDAVPSHSFAYVPHVREGTHVQWRLFPRP
jgi:hypothetical protein